MGSNRTYSCINSVQNRACRFFLGVPRTTSNCAVIGEMGWKKCLTKQRIEVFRLYSRVSNEDNLLPNCVYNWSKRRRKSWVNRVTALATVLKIPLNTATNSPSFMEKVKRQCHINDDSKWFQELWSDRDLQRGNKLRTYRRFKQDKTAENYLVSPMSRNHRKLLARLRCGTLKLEIETGRHTKPVTPYVNRKCKLCNTNSVEDEIHFLIDCPMYDDIRFDIFYNNVIEPNIRNLDSMLKLIYVMKCEKLQNILALCIEKMFKRRNMLLNL